MDFHQIEKLGQIPTSKLFGSSSFAIHGSTTAINNCGDIFLLNEDNGQIYYQNIRQSNTTSLSFSNDEEQTGDLSILPVEGISSASSSSQLKKFTNLLCNSEGTILCLWSKYDLAIIEIPSSFFKDGYLSPSLHNDHISATSINSPLSSPFPASSSSSSSSSLSQKCKFTSLVSIPSSSNNNTIVKVSFHPLNPNSLTVLLEKECLYLIDCRNYEKEQILLTKHLSFSSFSYGCNSGNSNNNSSSSSSNHEWFRFSLFLTANCHGKEKENNGLYYLCPIIPAGTILSKAILADLLNWMLLNQDQVNLSGGGNVENKKKKLKCLSLIKSCFQEKFGNSVVIEMIDNLRNNPEYYQELVNNHQSSLHSQYVIAENSRLLSFSSTSPGTPASLFSSPSAVSSSSLIERSHHELSIGEKVSTNYRLSLQGPMNILRSRERNSERTRNNVANAAAVSFQDVILPSLPSKYSELIAPILITSSSDGLIDVLLFDIVVRFSFLFVFLLSCLCYCFVSFLFCSFLFFVT
jgi:hypothetical protein